MPRMTQAEYQAFEARRLTARKQCGIPLDDATDDEAALHREVAAECTRRGWLAFHGSMAHRAHRTIGEPDFVILADGGQLLLIEAKTRTGKLTTEQAALHAWASKLGHTVHVVRSLTEFLTACQEIPAKK